MTALKCGHSYLTTSGNVSEHSSGDAVDIARHQRHPDRRPPGQGVDHRHHDPAAADPAGDDEAAPDHQPDDPADFGGADNILSLPDHYNHIHVGFHPLYHSSERRRARLKAGQWIKLIDRLNNIDNPTVPVKPSKDAIPVTRQKAGGHAGD